MSEMGQFNIHCPTIAQLDKHCTTIRQFNIDWPTIKQLDTHCLKKLPLFMHFTILSQIDKICLIIGQLYEQCQTIKYLEIQHTYSSSIHLVVIENFFFNNVQFCLTFVPEQNKQCEKEQGDKTEKQNYD